MYRHFPFCWCLKSQLDVDNDEPVLRASLFKAKEAGFTNNVGFYFWEIHLDLTLHINGTMTYFLSNHDCIPERDIHKCETAASRSCRRRHHHCKSAETASGGAGGRGYFGEIA